MVSSWFSDLSCHPQAQALPEKSGLDVVIVIIRIDFQPDQDRWNSCKKVRGQ